MELTNEGELLLDATCAPADIAYPTDLSLLNQAREKLEKIIDILHEPERGKTRKPRTYRERARKAYLAVAKQRRVKPRAIRKAIGKQLRFVSRDLRMIAELADMTSVCRGVCTRNCWSFKSFIVSSKRCMTSGHTAYRIGLSVSHSHMSDRSCAAKPGQTSSSERSWRLAW